MMGDRWAGDGSRMAAALIGAILISLAAHVSVGQQTSADQTASPPQVDKPTDAKDILNLDLEQLANTPVTVPAGTSMAAEVTSVSRTAEPIARTPAAVYVVTNEMIRRCGARNVPEVLRTVPGVDVAQINASTWAISIRGFNGRFANKLLVQIDGVAIYSPLHSGVFWERDPVMLEDVERIEVIRGPGGSLWGNNAVNGVINIITKSSKDTKGVYADVGGGTEHRQFSNLRVGGQSGDVAYRVWGSNADDNCGYVPNPGDRAVDSYRYAQGGFRADWTPTREDTITCQGDFVDGRSGYQGYTAMMEQFTPSDFSRRTLMSRWAHQTDPDTDWAVQAYYYEPYGDSEQVRECNTNFDVDFQYHAKRNRHDIVWGCGYRNDNEELLFNLTSGGWQPPSPGITNLDTEKIPSYFFQDTITLVEDRLFFTAGSKFDHNNITNFEYQPSAKLAYTPDERTSWWGAITRAVRTPSLKERANTHEDLDSETLLSYEIGYRRQATERCFWELAVFYNRYNNLIATATMSAQGYANVGDADTYGFEYNTTYQVAPGWRLTGSYSFFIECLTVPMPYMYEFPAGANPRNMFYFQSGWDLGHDVTFDLMFRYVDSLAMGVQKYFVGDIRVAWRPTRRFEMSVVGQNLFDGRHYEFYDALGVKATEVKPGVYGMVSWRY